MANRRFTPLLTPLLLCVGLAPVAHAQLNEHCIVSVLNRTAQVKPDGSWRIDNIPGTFGQVRARAACVENGTTRLLQSDLFVMGVGVVTAIPNALTDPTAVPSRLTITATQTTLTQPGQQARLTVTARFSDDSIRDVTRASAGTTYVISNPALATVTADGIVTAKASGTVMVQASNEGAQGILQLSIVLSGDADGDGIPDDEELRLGMDPRNPADALDDPDHDGLGNADELHAGTDIRNRDTDNDGLTDGQEVKVLHTNPLLKDTDGDDVPDNIEVATGSDPRNAASFNLRAALSGLRVTPASFVLNGSSGNGSGFQQLVVTGDFKLGGTIDLTSKSKGTTYISSNLQVCGFGSEDGRIFGVSQGSCIITAANSDFSATATGTVGSFSTRGLSKVEVFGYPNGVDAQGNFAYVAAGASGLVIVNVSDPEAPFIVGSVDTPGGAKEVRIVGNLAYVADETSLQIVDVSNPAAPTIVGSSIASRALDVVVFDNRAYVADFNTGLLVIDVLNPAEPNRVATVGRRQPGAQDGFARGVDVLRSDNGKLFAILVEGFSLLAGFRGLTVIDVTDVESAAVVAQTAIPGGTPRDLRIVGNFAYVVLDSGIRVVDLTNPFAPVLKGSFASGLRPTDVEIARDAAILADQPLQSAAPILDISNAANPVSRSRVDFMSLGPAMSGTGIAVRGPFVYLTATSFGFEGDGKVTSPGTTSPGQAALFVGQYLSGQDTLGVPPQVALTAPAASSSVIAGSTISLRANATDDVLVDAVTFQVNGTGILTDNAVPYEAVFAVPTNATTLSVSAKATDFGGNTATAPPVTLAVIPDPLTTVTGRVTRTVLSTSVPVVGALVDCLGSTTTTQAGGLFTFPGVPTVKGAISCTATFTEAGQVLQGKSFRPLPPVPGGVTTIPDFGVR